MKVDAILTTEQASRSLSIHRDHSLFRHNHELAEQAGHDNSADSLSLSRWRAYMHACSHKQQCSIWPILNVYIPYIVRLDVPEKRELESKRVTCMPL